MCGFTSSYRHDEKTAKDFGVEGGSVLHVSLPPSSPFHFLFLLWELCNVVKLTDLVCLWLCTRTNYSWFWPFVADPSRQEQRSCNRPLSRHPKLDVTITSRATSCRPDPFQHTPSLTRSTSSPCVYHRLTDCYTHPYHTRALSTNKSPLGSKPTHFARKRQTVCLKIQLPTKPKEDSQVDSTLQSLACMVRKRCG